MKLKTVLQWLAIAFVLFYVVKDPTGAAHFVHSVGAFLSAVASGVASFLSAL